MPPTRIGATKAGPPECTSDQSCIPRVPPLSQVHLLLGNSPLARLPTTSVAWKRSSSSVLHSGTLSSSCATLPLPFIALRRRFPPLRASALRMPASGLMTPCCTASSFLWSCPTISFFRFRSAMTWASGVVGLESSMSAGGMELLPIVRNVADCCLTEDNGASIVDKIAASRTNALHSNDCLFVVAQAYSDARVRRCLRLICRGELRYYSRSVGRLSSGARR